MLYLNNMTFLTFNCSENLIFLGHILPDINVKHTVKVAFPQVYKDDSVKKYFRFQLFSKILYGFVAVLSTEIWNLSHTKLHAMFEQNSTQILVIKIILYEMFYIKIVYIFFSK